MAEKLILKNPIMINGEMRSTFDYAPEKITGEQMDKIEELVGESRKPSVVVIAENDAVRHRYIAMMSIVAADPSIAIEDLQRIQGLADLEKLRTDGRRFFGAILEASQEDSSEKPTEHIAGDITQVQ